jgi:nucleoside-diphosphate-sugar epimerase
MEKILVVGANGFIGKEVLSHFGDKAIGIDMVLAENVLVVDITKKAELEKFFDENKISACIDFAGISVPLICEEQKELTYKVNVEGQKNLLDECAKHCVDYYYSSTVRLYDSNSVIATEESQTKATNYYSKTKILAEKQVKDFYEKGKLKKAIIFRFSNTFGRDPNKERLLPTIISSLKNGSIELTNANTKFDMLYVKDILVVIELAMKNVHGFEIFNVASGEQLAMKEIAKKISSKLENNSRVIIKDENEIIHPTISIEKVSSLGFKPTRFETALGKIIDFY